MKEKVIYALGFFDGVHRGHQALLSACQTLAREQGCAAGAVTFATHPETLVSGQAPLLLNSVEDRERLLFAYGAETVLTLPFDRALQTTHWAMFLRQLMEAGAAGFVCGSDFRFGAGGLGTAKKLEAFCKKQGLPCQVVPQQTLDGIRISSTHVRQLLEQGDVTQATVFLGHPHLLTGSVVQGRGLGHTIGIPTANIEPAPGVLLPKAGVYACQVLVEGKSYLAVTNIGSRPTVEGHHVTVEPWLLDFEGDLYGKALTIAFIYYLRPEEKFPSLEELKAQILKDEAKTRKIFENT